MWTYFRRSALALLLAVPASAILAEEVVLEAAATPEAASGVAPDPMPAPSRGHVGVVGISGNLGFNAYGVNDVNNRFLNGRDGSFRGGLGYGVAGKYGISERWNAKLGLDYMLAAADSRRVIDGTLYNSTVDLPATLLFFGAEYIVVPTLAMDLKLSAGYTLVSIFNGLERGSDGSNLDMGAISGSSSGAQIGAGLELYLSQAFSVSGELAYNFAKIERAIFSGAPSDPNGSSTQGVVDYSGLAAKVALTIYLIQ